MSLNKKVTLQLAQKRKRQKNQFTRKQEVLSREFRDPQFIFEDNSVPCAPCGDGMLEDCNEWVFPIEILFKGYWNVPFTDRTFGQTIELDLGDYNGSMGAVSVTLRNLSSGAPNLNIFVGGNVDGPWVPGPTYLFSTSPGGSFFWVRMKLEASRVDAKIWLDGNTEPGWQVFASDGPSSQAFNPYNGVITDLILRAFGDTNDTTGNPYWLIDDTEFTKGYVGPTLLETFTRTEVDAWGTSEFRDFEGPTSWVTSTPDLWSVNGSEGKFQRGPSDPSNGSIATQILLPFSVSEGCSDEFDRIGANSWGTGPLGTWSPTSHSALSTDGTWGILNHASVAMILGTIDDLDITVPVDLLFKFRVEPDGSANWSSIWRVRWGNNIFTTEATLTKNTSSVSVGAVDDRPGPGSEDFADNPSGIPNPPSNLTMRCRLFIDQYGTFTRFWQDGTAEPVNTAPLTPPTGGRGQKWHAYDTATVGTRDIVAFSQIQILAGSSTRTFKLESLEISQGCARGGCGGDRNVLNQGGDFLGVVSSEQYESNGAIVGQTVTGLCTRLSSTVYRLPTPATRVYSVSVDGLYMKGWTFTSPNIVTLAGPVVADSKVWTKYFIV